MKCIVTTINNKIINLLGKNAFQVRDINISYRIRGIVARIHKYIVAIIIVFKINMRLGIINMYPVKNRLVSKLIIKMLAYSAIKIMANRPLLYSILNPDTNSDSPSARSNGVRFVSAKFVIYHITNIGLIMRAVHEYIWFVIFCRSIV